VVSSVDRRGGPSLDLEPTCNAAGPSQERAAIVDHDDGEPKEPEPTCKSDRLVIRSLVELTVTEEAEDTSRAAGDPHTDRCSYGERKPVAKGPRRDLDTGH
jgi:hypothetical protein